MSRAKGRVASGFRPELHSRAESLSLESLERSRAVGQKSLDITKFGRKRLEMGHESQDVPKFCCQNLDWEAKISPKLHIRAKNLSLECLDRIYTQTA